MKTVEKTVEKTNVEKVAEKIYNSLCKRDDIETYWSGHSRTEYGESIYLYVIRKDTRHEVKMRISDHLVENIYRMNNEIHIDGTRPAPEGINFAIDMKLFPEKMEPVYNTYTKQIEVCEEQKREGDVVVGSRIANSGRVIYTVERKYTQFAYYRYKEEFRRK